MWKANSIFFKGTVGCTKQELGWSGVTRLSCESKKLSIRLWNLKYQNAEALALGHHKCSLPSPQNWFDLFRDLSECSWWEPGTGIGQGSTVLCTLCCVLALTHGTCLHSFHRMASSCSLGFCSLCPILWLPFIAVISWNLLPVDDLLHFFFTVTLYNYIIALSIS